MLFSSKRPDGEARVLPHWHQRISLVGLRLRSNEARRPFAENPPGGGSFARGRRWLGRYSPLRGCSDLAALATAKILRRSTPRSFQTGSAALAKGVHQIHRRGEIGHDNINARKVAQMRHRTTPEFRVVQAKNHFARRANHCLLNVNQQRVRIHHPVQSNAATAHNGHIRVQVGKSVHRQRPHQHTQPRIDHPAGNHDLNALRGSKEIRHGQRVGNHLHHLRFQMPCRVINRGARINYDALSHWHQACASQSNSLFLSQLKRIPP
jgi:hypothetical protein